MEKQIKVDEIAIVPCNCGGKPKGYKCFGKGTFFLECSPCGKRTARYASIVLAADDWNAGKRVAIPVVPQARTMRAVR